MFKKILAVVVLLFVPLFLSSCASVDKTSTPTQTSSVQPTPISQIGDVDTLSSVTTWDGTWTNDNSSMIAVVSGDNIVITLNSTDSESLYWQGSWSSVTPTSNGATVVSNADVEVLSHSLMGSQDTAKTFTLVDNKLEFSCSFFGKTATIKLKKS
jgi:hypothetical protein